MALGLTLGIVLAVSGGNATRIGQSSLGGSARPSGRASAAAPARASALPAPTATADHVTCNIIVPGRPLSAPGLSTPYQLTGPNGISPAASGCTMANAAALGALVQATIIDPRTGALSVYHPLVVTKGTTPSAAPTVPKLPRNAVVTIDFGFNGTNLIQLGATPGALAQGHCVSGLGSTSSCNGAAFFRAALALMREGRLHVPSEGTAADMVVTGGRLGTGRDCPNVRNFEVAGPDQAGSLVDDFIDPALGCKPFTAPDLGEANAPATSRALDELLAAGNEPRVAALVPEAGADPDPAKTSAYRAELGQPAVSAPGHGTDTPAAYCQNLVNLQAPFLAANSGVLAAAAAPVPAAATNLFTFLASRLSVSFSGLGCRRFGLTDPVTVVRDQAGAATSASFDTAPQQAAAGS